MNILYYMHYICILWCEKCCLSWIVRKIEVWICFHRENAEKTCFSSDDRSHPRWQSDHHRAEEEDESSLVDFKDHQRVAKYTKPSTAVIDDGWLFLRSDDRQGRDGQTASPVVDRFWCFDWFFIGALIPRLNSCC